MADRAHNSLEAGHEVTDAAALPLARVAVFLGIVLALTFFGIVILFKVLNYYQPHFDRQPHPLAGAREASAAPRLQTDPPTQKLELRASEERLLTTYDWVDQPAGLGRIPVKRAMDLLAERGLPKVKGPVQAPTATDGNEK